MQDRATAYVERLEASYLMTNTGDATHVVRAGKAWINPLTPNDL
jgi:hypothetical protein